jgi:triacylglycerol esterase/lipase EstA (alpha/beta hydrolase family)
MRLRPRRLPTRPALPALAGAAALAVLAAVLPAGAALAQSGTTALPGASHARVTHAQASLPVSYNFTASFISTFFAPAASPPGANNFACRPSAAHPYPVVLAHGTFENQNDNWQAAAPILANHGYCVFAFNYGGSSPGADLQGTGDIPAAAGQLASFVDAVLAATGAPKVDIVGHSQGGMMPRYYIDFLGGASKVDKLIGLAPPNFGTTLGGLTLLAGDLGLLGVFNTILSPSCTACVQQEQGSSFLAALNVHPTVPGVSYTVIESNGDEVVTPFTNAFLPAAPNVTDITLQRQCLLDRSDHLEIAYDPVAMADVLNALDPAHPVRVPCLTVLPLTGPVGPVPSF